jgi:gamma-glutamyltranspeptidase/glutathione hydrolase
MASRQDENLSIFHQMNCHMSGRKIIIVFIIGLIASCDSTKKIPDTVVSINPYDYKIEKKVLGENGAVVSAHTLASEVGVQILKMGGNAIDAAIATQFVLAVVYPNAGNLGGGGFMVAALADGKTIALDYREMAPGKASRDMYIDPD